MTDKKTIDEMIKDCKLDLSQDYPKHKEDFDQEIKTATRIMYYLAEFLENDNSKLTALQMYVLIYNYDTIYHNIPKEEVRSDYEIWKSINLTPNMDY